MLLPHEIRKKEFSHAINGYARGEVKSYLESVAVHFERLLRENDELSRKLDRACARLDEYQSREAEEIKAAVPATEVCGGFGNEKAKVRDEITKIKDELAAVLALLSVEEASAEAESADSHTEAETEEAIDQPLAKEVAATVAEETETENEPAPDIEESEESDESDEIDELVELDELEPIEEIEEIDELREYDELLDIDEIDELEQIDAECVDETAASEEIMSSDAAETPDKTETEGFDENLWGEIEAMIDVEEEPEQLGIDIPETAEAEAEPKEVAAEPAEETDIDALLDFIEPDDGAYEDFAFVVPDEFKEPEIEVYSEKEISGEPAEIGMPEADKTLDEAEASNAPEKITSEASAPSYKKRFFRITAVKRTAAGKPENEASDDDTSFDSEAEELLSALKEKFGGAKSAESEDDSFNMQDYDEYNYFFGDAQSKIETVPTKNDINDL